MSLLALVRRGLGLSSGDARHDGVALCRTIEPNGWEHVHAADARGRGSVLLIASGNRRLAVRAVGIWLAPAAVVADDPSLAPSQESGLMLDALAAALGEGRRVVVTSRQPRLAISQAAALARNVGCAVIPTAVRSTSKMSTLILGAPICASPDEGQAALETRLESSLEARP